MIKYQVQLNQGNEALNTGKSITANEVCETADNNFVAHHLHLHNPLVPEDVAKAVLNAFCETAAELMGQGYAIQLMKGGDVMMRIFPDVHLNGDNINLGRAKELMPEVADLTMDNAAELASRVGVSVRARVSVTKAFSDLLDQKKGGTERVAVVEKAYVSKNGNAATPAGGQPQGGASGDDPNAGND